MNSYYINSDPVRFNQFVLFLVLEQSGNHYYMPFAVSQNGTIMDDSKTRYDFPPPDHIMKKVGRGEWWGAFLKWALTAG